MNVLDYNAWITRYGPQQKYINNIKADIYNAVNDHILTLKQEELLLVNP